MPKIEISARASVASVREEHDVQFGPFCLQPTRHLLLKGTKPLEIGSRALDLLIALVAHAGELVTKNQLVVGAWPNTVVDESNLRVQIAALRKALGDGRAGARYVATVPGRGYRFVASVSRPAVDTISARVVEPLNNLPVRLTRPIGRDEVVASVSNRLQQRRFISIVGPGGVGKTTVALAVAYGLATAYDNQICFVDLASLSDPRLVPGALASTLGLPLIAQDPIPDMIAFLRDKRMLLVLDSCEHLVDVVATLAEKLLTNSPGIHVLATSREPLRAEGERVTQLAPLNVPPNSKGLTASEALAFPAVQLFAERTAARVEGFELTDASAVVVSDICRRLDGNALAIELAAGRVDAFGVHGVAMRLDDRFRLLTRGSRTALPRHQTLSATLDWSYESLSDPERMVLRRLAVFAGGFTLDSAKAVVSSASVGALDVPDLVADLAAKSLVASDAGSPTARYRLLDTTRAYAFAKLFESEEFDAVARRHADYYRGLFERAAAEWTRQLGAEWLALYGRDIDNLRGALDWAFSHAEDPSIVATLTVAAIPLWFQLSLTDECRGRVQQALTGLGPGPARDTRAREVMQLYAALGLSRTFTSGLAPEAPAAWTKALEIAESLADTEHQLGALWGLWACRIGTGEYRIALAIAQRFNTLARTADDPTDLLIGDRLLGVPLHYLGEHTKARRHIERMLTREVVSTKGSPSIRARFDQPVAARAILAHMRWLQGFPDQALHTAQTSVDDAQARSHVISLCDALAQAACPVALLIGDLAAAERFVAMLLERATDRALGPWYVLGCCLRGELLIRRGDLETGLPLLRTALNDLHDVRFALYHTGFLGTLAEGLARAGQTANGRAVIEEAIARAEHKEERWCTAELLRIKAVILLQENAANAAIAAENLLLQSLETARQQKALSWQLRTATTLARLRRNQDRGREARQLLATVYRRFNEGFGTTDLQLAKDLLDHLA